MSCHSTTLTRLPAAAYLKSAGRRRLKRSLPLRRVDLLGLGPGLFYSWCTNRVASGEAATRHCERCHTCVPARCWHCTSCDRCVFVRGSVRWRWFLCGGMCLVYELLNLDVLCRLLPMAVSDD